MSIADENLTIAYIYWMFLHHKFTTDTLHAGSTCAMSFLHLIGRDPHIGPPRPIDLAEWAQELVDKYATKERMKIVFTPCDGSPKDKGNKKNRKYWVVESNDPEYPLGSKVRRDRVNELMGGDNQFRARIRIGFGTCPTWCPHCNAMITKITNGIASLWRVLARRIMK